MSSTVEFSEWQASTKPNASQVREHLRDIAKPLATSGAQTPEPSHKQEETHNDAQCN